MWRDATHCQTTPVSEEGPWNKHSPSLPVAPMMVTARAPRALSQSLNHFICKSKRVRRIEDEDKTR